MVGINIEVASSTRPMRPYTRNVGSVHYIDPCLENLIECTIFYTLPKLLAANSL